MDIKDSYLSSEWNHVVFAKRENVDILDNDQLVVVLVEDGAVDQVPNVLLIALGEVEHGLGISLWGLAKTFSLGILSDTFKNGPDSSGQLLNSLVGLLRGRFQPLSSPGA